MGKQGQFQRQPCVLFPLCGSFSCLMFSRRFTLPNLRSKCCSEELWREELEAVFLLGNQPS